MNFIEQLELPLPTIQVSIEKICIETADNYEGSFTIFNASSGRLFGCCKCSKSLVTFSPEEFNKNRTEIKYFINIDTYNSGEVIRSEIIISSNGGEVIIPLIVKIIPNAIETEENVKITSLKEFYSYSKEYPNEAMALFSTNKFRDWLSSIGYEYMNIYKYLSADQNKDRGLYNFFILNKLKKGTTIEVQEKSVPINISYYEKSKFLNIIKVKKSDDGFVELDVTLKNNYDWISLSKNNLTSKDFRETNIADVMYSIDCSKINHKNVVEYIIIGNEVVKINVKRESLVNINISKECFKFTDSGSILISNNCKNQIVVEVSSNNNSIKFEENKYIVSKMDYIPFSVKLGAIAHTQLMLKKQPITTGEIYVKAHMTEGLIEKTIKVIIGDVTK